MRKKLSIAILVFLLLGSIITTLSFFTSQEVVDNKITTGSIKLLIHDDTKKDIKKIMPGDEIASDVKIENLGSGECYLRVKPVVKITKGDEALDTQAVEVSVDEGVWEKIGEYYYFKKALKVGEITPRVFDTVKFSQDTLNEYQSTKINLEIKAEAVQAKNNSDSYKKAVGWLD